MFRYCGAACHGVVIVRSAANIYKSNTLFYPVIANTSKVSQRDYRHFTQLAQALLIPYDL